MKQIIKKINQAVQMVLLAPIKLPGKALNFLKYVNEAITEEKKTTLIWILLFRNEITRSVGYGWFMLIK